MHPVNPLSGNAPYFIILRCLMPDDFTHQVESAATQWVKAPDGQMRIRVQVITATPACVWLFTSSSSFDQGLQVKIVLELEKQNWVMGFPSQGGTFCRLEGKRWKICFW
jgi:hypothetical protein